MCARVKPKFSMQIKGKLSVIPTHVTQRLKSDLTKRSRSEEFHFGDSLNLMQDEIESTLDQIELNIRKTWYSSLDQWNLLWSSSISYYKCC